MQQRWIAAALAALTLAACGDDGGGAGGGDGGHGSGSGSNHGDGGGSASEWLQISGHQILLGDGTPFHGRGANLHDERSCEACSFAARDPDGIDRWADELVDNWHATLVRFLLSAKASPYNAGEQQWMDLNDDPDYLADIIQNVTHLTGKPGVYVEVTLFADPTIKTQDDGGDDSEWPSSKGDSNPRYTALAEAFYDNPRVLFGLTNEPHGAASRDADLATVYEDAISAIRAVEDAHGTPHHVVVVQAPEGYARDLTYFVAHPLAGDQIAYEIHVYNPKTDFDKMITQPAKTLPIIIGEYGPADGYMTNDDITAMWPVAQAAGVPYMGWAFHQRCPPNMLQDTASDSCGLAASTGYDFPRTDWGDLLHDHLATPW